MYSLLIGERTAELIKISIGNAYPFDEEVKIVCQYMEDSYDGECFAILSLGHHYYLWKDSFGSCLGCDALEHEDGYEYIKDTMRNVKVIE